MSSYNDCVILRSSVRIRHFALLLYLLLPRLLLGFAARILQCKFISRTVTMRRYCMKHKQRLIPLKWTSAIFCRAVTGLRFEAGLYSGIGIQTVVVVDNPLDGQCEAS